MTAEASKDRSAHGTSASVYRVGPIMMSSSRGRPGWMRSDRGGAQELPIHALWRGYPADRLNLGPGADLKILTRLGEPLEPPPVSPARGTATDWAEFVQVHDYRAIFQPLPAELPAVDVHSV
jgi:hypothetical protein